jgi:hypothetical protein
VVATDGVKYVRVRAVYAGLNGNVPGPFTAAKKFTVDTVEPGVPVMTAPANRTVVTTRTPRLTWAAVPGAARYEVMLLSFAGPPVVLDTFVATTSITVPNSLGLANGYYLWIVISYDAAGNSNGPIDPFEFEVRAP